MELVGNNALSSMRPKLRNSVLVFGAGQVAQVFAEYLEGTGTPIAAVVVDPGFVAAGLCGRPRVFTDEVERKYPPSDYRFIIGMSFKGLNGPRAEKFAMMRAKGYEPLMLSADPTKVAWSAKIGAGSFVMEGNTIQTGAEVGENCVIWANNHIGHHTRIADHVFIASGVTIGGAVEIGERCFVGVGATIRDNVKIGARCVIGAGALILSDCAQDGVYSPGGTERSRVPSHRLRGI